MDIKQYQGAIFDLDGVLVDTAKYHYLAWKQLADELGFDFTRQQNEALNGREKEQDLCGVCEKAETGGIVAGGKGTAGKDEGFRHKNSSRISQQKCGNDSGRFRDYKVF